MFKRGLVQRPLDIESMRKFRVMQHAFPTICPTDPRGSYTDMARMGYCQIEDRPEDFDYAAELCREGTKLVDPTLLIPHYTYVNDAVSIDTLFFALRCHARDEWAKIADMALSQEEADKIDLEHCELPASEREKIKRKIVDRRKTDTVEAMCRNVWRRMKDEIGLSFKAIHANLKELYAFIEGRVDQEVMDFLSIDIDDKRMMNLSGMDALLLNWVASASVNNISKSHLQLFDDFLRACTAGGFCLPTDIRAHGMSIGDAGGGKSHGMEFLRDILGPDIVHIRADFTDASFYNADAGANVGIVWMVDELPTWFRSGGLSKGPSAADSRIALVKSALCSRVLTRQKGTSGEVLQPDGTKRSVQGVITQSVYNYYVSIVNSNYTDIDAPIKDRHDIIHRPQGKHVDTTGDDDLPDDVHRSVTTCQVRGAL